MKDVLVTLEERKWIAQNATIEMGKNVKVKVLDIDKAVVEMRRRRELNALAPFVIIKPVVENQNKEQRMHGTYQRDPETGVYYGIPLREDEFGNVMWRKLRIVETETLRIMDSMDDAKIWTALRFHPKLKNSPWEMSTPPFVVFDPIKESRKDISKAKHMKEAFKHIDVLSEKPVDMMNFCRFLGEEITSYATVDMIEGKLHSIAMKDPLGFIEKFRNPNRAYNQIFYAAYQVGLISELPGEGYYYKNTPLGQVLPDVIEFLKKDKVILMAIVSEIEEQDEAAHLIKRELENS